MSCQQASQDQSVHKSAASPASFAAESLTKRLDIPTPVRAAFWRALENAQSGEQLLWCEVAARMTLDAFGIMPTITRTYNGMPEYVYRRYRKAVGHARAWFGVQDASHVFTFAGVDLRPVQNAIKELPDVVEPENFSPKRTKHAVAA